MVGKRSSCAIAPIEWKRTIVAVTKLRTALHWQGSLIASAMLLDAAMFPTCSYAHGAAGHNAIRV